jgi:hypothetical protein
VPSCRSSVASPLARPSFDDICCAIELLSPRNGDDLAASPFSSPSSSCPNFFYRGSLPSPSDLLDRVHVSLAAQGRLRGERMPVRNGSELVPFQLQGLQVRGRAIDLIRADVIVKTNEDGDGSSIGAPNENERGRRDRSARFRWLGRGTK